MRSEPGSARRGRFGPPISILRRGKNGSLAQSLCSQITLVPKASMGICSFSCNKTPHRNLTLPLLYHCNTLHLPPEFSTSTHSYQLPTPTKTLCFQPNSPTQLLPQSSSFGLSLSSLYLFAPKHTRLNPYLFKTSSNVVSNSTHHRGRRRSLQLQRGRPQVSRGGIHLSQDSSRGKLVLPFLLCSHSTRSPAARASRSSELY